MSRNVEGGNAQPVHITGSDSDDTLPITGTVTANQGTAQGTTGAWPTTQRPRDAASADVHVPATGNAAAVVYAAAQGVRHVISGIAWSYGSAPTGGSVAITGSASGVVFSSHVTATGMQSVQFNPPKRFADNESVTVSLASGGGAVAGRLNVTGHWTE